MRNARAVPLARFGRGVRGEGSRYLRAYSKMRSPPAPLPLGRARGGSVGRYLSPFLSCLCIFLGCFVGPVVADEKQPVDFINPLIGASTADEFGAGKTFPGAATPFGLVQLSPDTITGGDNGPGYSYDHKTIEGFSFTHLSGIGWYGELGNFQVMPTTGELQIDRDRAKSPFSHDEEIAQAGYYSVMLKRYGHPRGNDGSAPGRYPAIHLSRGQDEPHPD